MPTVQTFSRSDNELLQELLKVFSSGQGTAREQWSSQAEMLVEPVGWDALWKLSKSFCKRFDERFPCIAFVAVTSVDFENLSASVEVLSVQHESVTLPETVVDVPLIELWPTVKQREKCINADTTADIIDLMRFFYTDIWMPWDDQGDKDLLPNTIEERMQLWFELHNGVMPHCVARSVILLRSSAIDAHERLQALDDSLTDRDMANDDDSLLPPNYILQCAELNAKLDSLMSQWTLYENTLIREQYLAKVRTKWQKDKSKNHVVALWQGGPKEEFQQISEYLCSRLSSEHSLSVVSSAEQAFALEPVELVICSKTYEIPEVPLMQINVGSFNGATLLADSMRSCLITTSEQCCLQALTLQCARVCTAVLARGALTLRHCAVAVHDTTQSDITQGLVAMSGAKVLIENCTFDNFYSGIVVHKGAEVIIKNSEIRGCGVGVQLYPGARAELHCSAVSGSREHAVRCDLDTGDTPTHAQVKGLRIMGDCKIGSGNLDQEILIVQQEAYIM